MLDHLLQTWPVTAASRFLEAHTGVQCCLTVTNALSRPAAGGIPFASNGLRKREARSLSDAAILYSLRDYINDLDGVLEANSYFSDSEISSKSRRWRPSRENGEDDPKFSSDRPLIKSNEGEDLPEISCVIDEPVLIPEENGNKKTLRKSVSFADDIGLHLTVVNVFENQYTSTEVVCTNNTNFASPIPGDPTLMCYRWLIEFCIPCRQYASFREKVNTQMVSLENIHVDEERGPVDLCLCGSIKVKNIAFNKHVFVRITYDSWTTSEDQAALHQPSREQHPRFDAFVFRVPLRQPRRSGERIEFAVCFQTDGHEFWDNNNSNNYLLTSHSFSPNQIKGLNSPQSPTESTHEISQGHGSFTNFRIWDYVQAEVTYY